MVVKVGAHTVAVGQLKLSNNRELTKYAKVSRSVPTSIHSAEICQNKNQRLFLRKENKIGPSYRYNLKVYLSEVS